MNVVCKIVVGFAGTLVVALALQLTAPKAVHAVVSHFITVDNTAANPVPIAGSVNVANTANVNVTNTPSVNVANIVPVTGTVAVNSLPAVQLGGSVNVTNATNAKGNPVLVTDSDAARNSFLVSGNCSFGQASQLSRTIAPRGPFSCANCFSRDPNSEGCKEEESCLYYIDSFS